MIFKKWKPGVCVKLTFLNCVCVPKYFCLKQPQEAQYVLQAQSITKTICHCVRQNKPKKKGKMLYLSQCNHLSTSSVFVGWLVWFAWYYKKDLWIDTKFHTAHTDSHTSPIASLCFQMDDRIPHNLCNIEIQDINQEHLQHLSKSIKLNKSVINLSKPFPSLVSSLACSSTYISMNRYTKMYICKHTYPHTHTHAHIYTLTHTHRHTYKLTFYWRPKPPGQWHPDKTATLLRQAVAPHCCELKVMVANNK